VAGLTNRELIAQLSELDPNAEVVIHSGCGVTSAEFSTPSEWNPDTKNYELRSQAQITLENDCYCGYGG
jgi:hypothetical protein